MSETKLAGIVETSVKESANHLLLQYMKRYFAAESEIGIFETSGIPMLDKPKSKVALAEINELSDKIGAVDGASLQCQIWLLRSGGLAERFLMAGIHKPRI